MHCFSPQWSSGLFSLFRSDLHVSLTLPAQDFRPFYNSNVCAMHSTWEDGQFSLRVSKLLPFFYQPVCVLFLLLEFCDVCCVNPLQSCSGALEFSTCLFMRSFWCLKISESCSTSPELLRSFPWEECIRHTWGVIYEGLFLTYHALTEHPKKTFHDARRVVGRDAFQR